MSVTFNGLSLTDFNGHSVRRNFVLSLKTEVPINEKSNEYEKESVGSK